MVGGGGGRVWNLTVNCSLFQLILTNNILNIGSVVVIMRLNYLVGGLIQPNFQFDIRPLSGLHKPQ